MRKYEVEIKGITPLLMNKPEEYGFDEQWIEKKASADWEKEAYKKIYMDADEVLYQPAEHIIRTLIDAGKKIRMKGAGKATYSKIFGSMVQVEPDAIPHLNQEWTIHKSLVVIPSTKGRVMRYRPQIKDWGLKFDVLFEEEIKPETIKEAFEIAGKYSGLGDWRPEKKGRFGKFQVVSFKEAE